MPIHRPQIVSNGCLEILPLLATVMLAVCSVSN